MNICKAYIKSEWSASPQVNRMFPVAVRSRGTMIRKYTKIYKKKVNTVKTGSFLFWNQTYSFWKWQIPMKLEIIIQFKTEVFFNITFKINFALLIFENIFLVKKKTFNIYAMKLHGGKSRDFLNPQHFAAFCIWAKLTLPNRWGRVTLNWGRNDQLNTFGEEQTRFSQIQYEQWSWAQFSSPIFTYRYTIHRYAGLKNKSL